MSSKINLQTCEYACKSSIFQDNQLIFNKNITKQYILDVLVKPILDGREQTFIRIQKGRINIQFIVHKNETIECVYN